MTERRERKEYGPFIFTLLAFVTGVVADLGAYLFRLLIALNHNLFFNGSFALLAADNLYAAASRWGLFVVFAPVAGAAGAVYLVKNYAPEAQGHGVPEVMDAIYYGKGVIRPVVADVKSLASALTIVSGELGGIFSPSLSLVLVSVKRTESCFAGYSRISASSVHPRSQILFHCGPIYCRSSLQT